MRLQAWRAIGHLYPDHVLAFPGDGSTPQMTARLTVAQAGPERIDIGTSGESGVRPLKFQTLGRAPSLAELDRLQDELWKTRIDLVRLREERDAQRPRVKALELDLRGAEARLASASKVEAALRQQLGVALDKLTAANERLRETESERNAALAHAKTAEERTRIVLREARAFCEDRDVALVQVKGAEERAQIMLRAKNYWRDLLWGFADRARGLAPFGPLEESASRLLLRDVAEHADSVPMPCAVAAAEGPDPVAGRPTEADKPGVPNDLPVTIRGDYAVAIANALGFAALGGAIHRAGELAHVVLCAIESAKQLRAGVEIVPRDDRPVRITSHDAEVCRRLAIGARQSAEVCGGNPAVESFYGDVVRRLGAAIQGGGVKRAASPRPPGGRDPMDPRS